MLGTYWQIPEIVAFLFPAFADYPHYTKTEDPICITFSLLALLLDWDINVENASV